MLIHMYIYVYINILYNQRHRVPTPSAAPGPMCRWPRWRRPAAAETWGHP